MTNGQFWSLQAQLVVGLERNINKCNLLSVFDFVRAFAGFVIIPLFYVIRRDMRSRRQPFRNSRRLLFQMFLVVTLRSLSRILNIFYVLALRLLQVKYVKDRYYLHHMRYANAISISLKGRAQLV